MGVRIFTHPTEGEDCEKKERINKLAEMLTREQEKKNSLQAKEKKIPQQIQECDERIKNLHEKMRCQFISFS